MMDLWCKLSLLQLLLLLVTCVPDWSAAQDYEVAELPSIRQFQVEDICGLSLRLENQQNLTNVARDEVLKKDGTIRLLNDNIKTAKNELQLVQESAETAKQQHKIWFKKHEDCQQQLTENDVLASRQREDILNLTTEIRNKFETSCASIDNLWAQVSSLKTELKKSESFNNQLSEELTKKKQQLQALVLKYDATIILLNAKIENAENMLQLVNESAESAKQQLIVCGENLDSCNQQVRENNADASRQRESILNMTAEIHEQIRVTSSRCDTLQTENSNLKTELIDLRTNNTRLLYQLNTKTEEVTTMVGQRERVDGKLQTCQHQLGDINSTLITITQENMKLNQSSQDFTAKNGATLYAVGGTKVYLYKSTDKANYTEAQQKCQDMGMWLSKPVGPELNRILHISLVASINVTKTRHRRHLGVCAPDEFECRSDKNCISETFHCDAYPDCADESDEENCPSPCPPSEFECGYGVCIPQSKRCDGTRDCESNIDEVNCPRSQDTTFMLVPVCSDDQFQCGDGSCIPMSSRCDSVKGCPDNSDEENCGSCGSGDFQCTDSIKCISTNFRCDSYPDCDDGSDEQNCPVPCQESEFSCGDGSCIPEAKRCDRRRDCLNGIDETACLQPREVDDTRYWIGGEIQYSRWVWADPGERSVAFTFFNWRVDRPNGGGNCLSVSKSDNRWNDQSCSEKLNYICQYPRFVDQ